MILGLSSFPGRLCPAITARGLSDSIVSSAEIHSRRVCAFDGEVEVNVVVGDVAGDHEADRRDM
jgi:hypothetical protein